LKVDKRKREGRKRALLKEIGTLIKKEGDLMFFMGLWVAVGYFG